MAVGMLVISNLRLVTLELGIYYSVSSFGYIVLGH
jgi:hypothetical protein